MLLRPLKLKARENQSVVPYCQCFKKREPVPSQQVNVCSCGEDVEVREWKWQAPEENSQSWVVLDDNQKQVTFHPFYSSGTAAVRGDTPFRRDHHYYFEVKMLTDTFGTDIMVGIGTDKVNIAKSRFKFTSLLGEDEHSYGLSYRGCVRHDAKRADEGLGFCRGSIVGVRVDMWQGTLEFYVNRISQGISFYNLRRHHKLFPMVCSTAAQSTMRLIYAASFRASLLVDAAKILSASVSEQDRAKIPPGLWTLFKPHFWMLMPTEDWLPDSLRHPEESKGSRMRRSTSSRRRHWPAGGARDMAAASHAPHAAHAPRSQETRAWHAAPAAPHTPEPQMTAYQNLIRNNHVGIIPAPNSDGDIRTETRTCTDRLVVRGRCISGRRLLP